jgi:hypothetical protein
MSDLLYIEKGASPWKPAESTKLVEVFHAFTIPLVGLLDQDNVLYLFWCVVGHAGPENAWGYARIEDANQLEALRRADHETFEQELRSAVADRACLFAIASDDSGIIQWVSLDPPAAFDTIHERGMTELGRKVGEIMSELSQIMAQYPSLQAVTGFAIAPSPRLISVE